MIKGDKILNVPLFNALCDIFGGDVGITNEGQEGYIETIKSGTDLLAIKSRECEQYMVNCPECGDRRHRLYISHWALKKVMKGKKTVCTDPLFYCQNEPTICKHTELRRKIRSIINPDVYKPVTVPINQRKHKGKILELPEGCIPVNDPETPIAVKDYLEGRGFDLDILYNGWGVYAIEHLEEYPQNGPKIIYPVIYNNKLAFWQARIAWDPTKEQQKQGVLKYYFPQGSNKSNVIYNKDEARLYKVIFIVEGITDVHRVGPASCAIFGKVPNMRQTQIFQNALGHSTGVMLLDSDASEDAEKYVKKYKNDIFNGGFHMVRLDKGDPASYSKEELQDIIMSKIGNIL